METLIKDVELLIGDVRLSFPAKITYEYHKNSQIVIIHDLFNNLTGNDVNGWLASTSLAFDIDLANIYQNLELMIRDHETAGDLNIKPINIMPIRY